MSETRATPGHQEDPWAVLLETMQDAIAAGPDSDEWVEKHVDAARAAVDASHAEEMQQAAEERAARHALEIMNLKAERNAADRRLAEVEKERDAAEAALSELRAITEPWQTVHHLDPHQCVFGRFHPVEEVDLARQAERAQFRVELTALREELAAVQRILRKCESKLFAVGTVASSERMNWPTEDEGRNHGDERGQVVEGNLHRAGGPFEVAW